jgi:hypothetical protein
MSSGNFQDAALTLLDHSLFAPPCPYGIGSSDFTSQDDVSHPDTERELVFGGSLRVETRELGDELVRRSIDECLRISPLWRFGLT